MKRKWLLPLCITAGVLLLCAAAVLIAVGVITEKGFSVTPGRLYLEEDQVWLIEDSGGAVSLSDRTKTKDLFQNSVSGDRVLVLHDWMLETYPAQTGAYMLWCLEEGDGSYRPEDAVLGRVDIGWHDRGTYLLDTMTDYEFEARYIRTDGFHENIFYPQVKLIRSAEQLQEYCEENRSLYQFEQKADGAESFLEACRRYDAAYFEKQCLILVLLKEGSGSVRHKVDRVGTGDGSTVISIQTITPEVGTCDMALWHILIEPEPALAVPEVGDGDVTLLLDETEAVMPERTVTYSTEQAQMSVKLLAGWTSSVTDEGITVWPENRADGKLRIAYYPGGFGVCGTGLSSKEIQLGENKAVQGTYDGAKLWDFISIGRQYAVINEGADAWWNTCGQEAMQILETLTIGN